MNVSTKLVISFSIVGAALSLAIITAGGVAVPTAIPATFAQQPQHFTARLLGGSEVPSIITKASGIAKFELNTAGTEMKYTMNVTDIDNVIAAHIHNGKSTENGPIVANLFISGKPTSKVSGILAQGSINSTSLIGPLKDKHIPDLLNLIKNGQAYVNVHTSQNPSGEIRGTISAG